MLDETPIRGRDADDPGRGPVPVRRLRRVPMGAGWSGSAAIRWS